PGSVTSVNEKNPYETFMRLLMQLRPPALQHPCDGTRTVRASGSAPGSSRVAHRDRDPRRGAQLAVVVAHPDVPYPARPAAGRRRADMGAGTWESHHAIPTLMFRYAECVHTADFDGIAGLFENGPITNEGVQGAIEGPDAVRKLYHRTNRVHHDATTRTRHVN